MRVADFDYVLPEELIAQHPTAQRSASRLLHLDGRSLSDLAFADLPSLLGANDLLVINDTRVVKARLAASKRSGGRLEVFVERALSAYEALAMIRANHPPAIGSSIRVGDKVEAHVQGRQGDLYRLRFSEPVAAVLDALGALPLPPYIGHSPTPLDSERYQTVYADKPGAVAAPTAGLHFDAATLQAVRATGARIARLTLHVGAGTFLPVRVADTDQHRMHSERYSIPAETVAAVAATRAAGGKVLAVGTTALRALESATRDGELQAGAAETDLFVTPGFRFRAVDRLITNFHLPKSTLLMLVSAFGGIDNIRAAYAHAIEARYRFFSYGDAMLIERAA